jgi:hypothetical protein
MEEFRSSRKRISQQAAMNKQTGRAGIASSGFFMRVVARKEASMLA